MLHLDHRDARPIYIQITDGIRHQITGGALQQGDRLPSVRELAMALAINPNTIQRSYRQLEMEGWIATLPGKGCFVCGPSGGDLHTESKLLRDFDEAARKLMEIGYSKQQLAARLEQEDEHA